MTWTPTGSNPHIIIFHSSPSAACASFSFSFTAFRNFKESSLSVSTSFLFNCVSFLFFLISSPFHASSHSPCRPSVHWRACLCSASALGLTTSFYFRNNELCTSHNMLHTTRMFGSFAYTRHPHQPLRNPFAVLLQTFPFTGSVSVPVFPSRRNRASWSTGLSFRDKECGSKDAVRSGCTDDGCGNAERASFASAPPAGQRHTFARRVETNACDDWRDEGLDDFAVAADPAAGVADRRALPRDPCASEWSCSFDSR